MNSREAFEAWVSAPPFEYSIERMTALSAWPGNYRNLEVQLAWEAWQAATLAERDECSKVCDNMAVGEGDEDYVIGSAWCAAAIRARSNAALTGAAKDD